MGNSLINGYNALVKMLPLPITEIKKVVFEDNFYTPSFTVLTSSTATLSFLYLLYTLDAKKINRKYTIKVEGIVDTNTDAIKKLISITERLKELGNDFPTMLENLRTTSYLLL
jgi:hypothetical protein